MTAIASMRSKRAVESAFGSCRSITTGSGGVGLGLGLLLLRFPHPFVRYFRKVGEHVSQLASHLREEHGPDCREEISERLLIMAESFKDLAENAMEVLDNSEKVFKHGAQ